MRKLVVKLGIVAAASALALQVATPALGLPATPAANKKVFNLKGRAAIGTGTLKSKSGNTVPATLVVTKDGTDYNVTVDANTQLRRRFWGKATLSEFQVNDTINIIGLWADDAHTTIKAKLVRDLSIQKRFGTFIGTVLSLTSDGWTMQTGRGAETVAISSTTKLVNRKEQAITKADVQTGHKVRVRGLWDTQANTITEVSHVKDYSLPPKTTP